MYRLNRVVTQSSNIRAYLRQVVSTRSISKICLYFTKVTILKLMVKLLRIWNGDKNRSQSTIL